MSFEKIMREEKNLWEWKDSFEEKGGAWLEAEV